MDQDELIKKWLSDELSQTEVEAFKKLDDYDLNIEILEGAKQFKAPQFSAVDNYEVLKSKLNTTSTIEETPVIKLNAFKVLSRIAAIFVVGLGLYFAFFTNDLTTVETLAGNQTTFELPDASSVTLNATSEASYNKKDWATKREINLKGEAYFKVAKGSKFDVITSDGTVSVLGTQFTVKNRKDYFEVKCLEGIVRVETNGITETLTKGKTVRVTGKKVTKNVIVNEDPEWLHNKSNFNSVPFSEVINEFERQYNVTINTDDIDTTIIFTGGFLHTNLEQALKSITIPLDISVKKNNETNITLYSSK